MTQHDDQAPSEAGEPARLCNENEQRRVHDVELLFHRQRPEVLEWGGRLELGEVIGAGGNKVEVGQKDGGPDTVVGRLISPYDSQQGIAQHDGDNDRHARGGE
jgi:hypothetical protein